MDEEHTPANESTSAWPNDVSSPAAITGALYDVISGPAEQSRDWARFRSLFEPGARLIAYTKQPDGTPQEGAWSVEEFIEAATRFYAEQGFWENELWSRTDRFRNVAHVLSTYESRAGSRDAAPVARGINSIQIVRHDRRWWITSIAFEIEQRNEPIPEEYLPPGA